MQPRRRGFHGNSRRDRRRAGGGKAVAALDLDEAQAARAEGFDAVGRAELGISTPISIAARMIDVPSGRLTSLPSIVKVTVFSDMEAGVP
jgi:hypothetical protein